MISKLPIDTSCRQTGTSLLDYVLTKRKSKVIYRQNELSTTDTVEHLHHYYETISKVLYFLNNILQYDREYL